MEDKKVFHNGEYFSKSDMLRLMKSEPDYTSASPFIVSLMMYAYEYRDDEVIAEINKYGQSKNHALYPVTLHSPASEHNMPKHFDEAEQCRSKFRLLNEEQQIKLLKECMGELLKNNQSLFDKKQCWIGVFLVIRDRLDGKIKGTSFFEYANQITPDEMPTQYKITRNTMSNLSRHIKPSDREEAYYDMVSNPFKDLCERFWEITKDKILTNF